MDAPFSPLPNVADLDPPPLPEFSCSNCKYSFVDQAKNTFCRRHPPTVFLTGINRDDATKVVISNEQVTVMPIVNGKFGWCGEHILAKSVIQ